MFQHLNILRSLMYLNINRIHRVMKNSNRLSFIAKSKPSNSLIASMKFSIHWSDPLCCNLYPYFFAAENVFFGTPTLNYKNHK